MYTGINPSTSTTHYVLPVSPVRWIFTPVLLAMHHVFEQYVCHVLLIHTLVNKLNNLGNQLLINYLSIIDFLYNGFFKQQCAR